MNTQDLVYTADSSRLPVGPVPGAPIDFAIAESNHRIANNLALLISSISLRASDVVRHPRTYRAEDVSLMLGEISARLASVAWLHRFLSQKPSGDLLDLNGHLYELCETLVSALSHPERVMLERSGAGACRVTSAEVVPVCLIVTEVVTNSLKYAHPTGVAGRLSVGCRSDSHGGLVIEVSDDGIGLPEDFDPATGGGIGSRTIRVLARQLGAATEYENRGCGLTFRLRLPPRD